MKLLATFFLAVFISISVIAGICPRCHQEFGDIEIHICIDDDSAELKDSLESENSGENQQKSHKRPRGACGNDTDGSCKKLRLNKKPQLSELDRALIEAARDLDLKTIKELLEKGSNINAADENGSVLHHALENLMAGIRSTDDELALFAVEFLIEQGADPMDAVFRGDIVELLEAISYLDDLNEWSASNSDLEEEENDDDSDEHYINYGKKLLAILTSKIDVHAVNKEGMTPLMILVQYIEPNIVQSLISAGAQVNAVDDSGTSVLEYALKTPLVHPAIPTLLVQHGAFCNRKALALAHSSMQEARDSAIVNEHEQQAWVHLIILIKSQLENLWATQQVLSNQIARDGSVLPQDVQVHILKFSLGL